MNVNEKIAAIYKGSQIIDSVIKNRKTIYSMLKTLQGIPPFNFVSIGGKVIDYKIFGNTKQNITSGKQLFNYLDTNSDITNFNIYNNGFIEITYDNSYGSSSRFYNYYTNNLNLKTNTQYSIILEVEKITGDFLLALYTDDFGRGQFVSNIDKIDVSTLEEKTTYVYKATTKTNFENSTAGLRTYIQYEPHKKGTIKFRISVYEDLEITPQNFVYEKFGASPSPDYPSEIKSVGELQNIQGNITYALGNFTSNNASRLRINNPPLVEQGKKYIIETNLDFTKYNMATTILKNNQLPLSNTSDVTQDSGWITSNINLNKTPLINGYLGIIVCHKDGTNLTLSEMSNYNFIIYEESKKYAIPVEVNDETTTTIYSNQPLRKIGDYADYIDFESGKVHRKILEERLDKNKDWVKDNGNRGYIIMNYVGSKIPYMYSNRFKCQNDFNTWTGIGNFGINNNGVLWFQLTNELTNNWIDFVTNNELIIDYILEDEIVEDIELPEILTVKGENTLDVDTTILPSNMIINYK